METNLRVLSLGAGVQSTTLALMVGKGEVPMVDFAIFADTQGEPDYIYKHLKWLKDKVPFEILVTSKGDLTDNCLRALSGEKKTADGLSLSGSAIPFYITKEDGKKGMGIRQCTVSYKIETIMKVVRKKLGYEKGRRVKKDVNVEMLLGISQDEVYRVKKSRYHYVTHEYPLIDKKLTRKDCLDWMEKFDYPIPQRSACFYCPYHSDNYWLWLRSNHKEDFNRAVEFDKQIRVRNKVLRGTPYVHKSRKPLGEIDFDEKENEQLDLFNEECEGMCGV